MRLIGPPHLIGIETDRRTGIRRYLFRRWTEQGYQRGYAPRADPGAVDAWFASPSTFGDE